MADSIIVVQGSDSTVVLDQGSTQSVAQCGIFANAAAASASTAATSATNALASASSAAASASTAATSATNALASAEAAALNANTIFFDTKAAMDADLTSTAGKRARVRLDPTSSNNIYYSKLGEPSTGSWEADADLYIPDNTVTFPKIAQAAVDSINAQHLGYTNDFSSMTGVEASRIIGTLGTLTATQSSGVVFTLVDGETNSYLNYLSLPLEGKGITNVKATIVPLTLTSAASCIGFSFGDAGASRVHVAWKDNGQVLTILDDGTTTTIISANTDIAYTSTTSLALEAIVDFDTGEGDFTYTVDGVNKKTFTATGLVVGDVGIHMRANGSYNIQSVENQFSPTVVNTIVGTLEEIKFNSFPDPYWSLSGAKMLSTGVNPVVTEESDINVVSMTTTDTLHRFGYDLPVIGTVDGLQISGSVEVYQTAASKAKLQFIFLDSSAVEISRFTASTTTTDAYTTISLLDKTIPTGTATIRIAFDNNAATGTYTSKFRNPIFVPKSAIPTGLLNTPEVSVGGVTVGAGSIAVVATTGSDTTGEGTTAKPFATVNRALQAIGGIGTVELTTGDYYETIETDYVVAATIRRARAGLGRVRIMGSTLLSLTKTVGYTQIYEAALASEPTSSGEGYKDARIFEDATSSMAILDAERHPLQRGQTYRLDFTEMYKAASLAELDTEGGRGKWWYEGGKIYLAATDGGDATLKAYHVPTRKPLGSTTGKGGILDLHGIEFYYSSSVGADFTGLNKVSHSDCRFMGSKTTGTANDQISLYYTRAEFGGNGQDGDNSHMNGGYGTSPLRSGVNSQVCIDGWYHDNGDDGKSEHERGEVTIIGGLSEYNWDRGLAMSYGAHYTVYNMTARKNAQKVGAVGEGFCVIGASTDGGDGTNAVLYNCVSEDNKYNYLVSADSRNKLELYNCIARNAITYNYYASDSAAMIRNNCTWTGGTEKATATSGTITTNIDAACST